MFDVFLCDLAWSHWFSQLFGFVETPPKRRNLNAAQKNSVRSGPCLLEAVCCPITHRLEVKFYHRQISVNGYKPNIQSNPHACCRKWAFSCAISKIQILLSASVTSNIENLNGVIQFFGLNLKQWTLLGILFLRLYLSSTFQVQIWDVTKNKYFSLMWSRMMKHVSQACNFVPGDRLAFTLTLPYWRSIKLKCFITKLYF